jgi:shikimate kinase
MSIILIGYRGSGKTTVGRQLAGRLGYSFVDSDERIVLAEGKTIKDIFEQEGEKRFRDLETEIVQALAGAENQVISLGGGAILREQNRRAIQAGESIIIYLRAEAEELHRRIHTDIATAANRPHLTHLGGGIEEIRSVLAQREPIYRQVMTAEVDVTRASVEEVVTAILKLLKDR